MPGAVAGWDALLRRFGTKGFVDVLAPAIAHAKAGFPVSELFGEDWGDSADYLLRDAEATRVFLPGRRAPQVGEIFRNPDLAASLAEIAKDGSDAFYKGAIAQRVLATSARLGGTMAGDDLADFAAEWVDPIATDYRGWTVYELPPNEQGIAALMMLNIMSTAPLDKWGHNSVEALHLEIEAKKLAYADMLRYVADPRFAKVPVAGMISAEYGRERAKLVDPAHANCSVGPGTPPYPGSDTTYLATVDREGNMVSLIQSNFGLFGSGVAVEGGGFVLQNRGALFSLELGHPERARRPQAPAAHHHSRVDEKRRRPHSLRHHGRIQPGPGARPIRVEHRRPRHEHPGRNGSAALLQGELCRLRPLYRITGAGIGARRARQARASAATGRHVLRSRGRRPGGDARHRRHQLRRIRSAQGRRGDRGDAVAAVNAFKTRLTHW